MWRNAGRSARWLVEASHSAQHIPFSARDAVRSVVRPSQSAPAFGICQLAFFLILSTAISLDDILLEKKKTWKKQSAECNFEG